MAKKKAEKKIEKNKTQFITRRGNYTCKSCGHKWLGMTNQCPECGK